MAYRAIPDEHGPRSFVVRTRASSIAARALAAVGLVLLGLGTYRLARQAFRHQELEWPLVIAGAVIVMCSFGIAHAAGRRIVLTRVGAIGKLAVEGTAIVLELPLAISGAQTQQRVRTAVLGTFTSWVATLRIVDAKGKGIVIRELRGNGMGPIEPWFDGPADAGDLPTFDVTDYDALVALRAAVEG